MKPDYCDQASHQERNHQQQHKPARFPFSDNHMASLDAVRAFLVRLAVDLFTKLRSMGGGGETVIYSENAPKLHNLLH
jgi:hypothetical protein